MENKKTGIFKTVLFLILIVFIVQCVTYILFGESDLKDIDKHDKEINKQLSRVEELLNEIDEKYIFDVDFDELGAGALSGIMYMVEDPYSRYMTKEQFQGEVTPQDDEYVGIGIVVSYDAENVGGLISSITPDSPAAKGGLWIGDIIVEVDDKIVKDEDTYYEAIDSLKGKENTKTTVTFLRDGKKMTKELVRNKIVSKNITYTTFGDVGYIKIYAFDFNVYDEFKKAYKELDKKDIKKLIIDVRNNGGGLVDETVDIVDMLVPDNEVILTTKYKYKEDVVEISKDGKKTDMDVIVLGNEKTASASELLISSLKDLGVAKFMGEKTFGKGIVQIYEGLSEGDGIALTFAEYFTKSNTKIHKIGLKPDIEFISTDDEKRLIVTTDENDAMIREAIKELNRSENE